ncbi:hypothetical protein DEU56DRAFT_805244 [Suillus clintonianus]|uniref:uncharacterized protein n=1 Tax=Suillus clintonianus TaxID=1904413 RepID=UPI001B8860A3|nr:uncharacterized protein DEU56DRAFT_805244 [Suillus clintonianus]KAG2136663.1 hypothetical protein DEU56DRAFT_805244 [Suillus clintonianus]
MIWLALYAICLAMVDRRISQDIFTIVINLTHSCYRLVSEHGSRLKRMCPSDGSREQVRPDSRRPSLCGSAAKELVDCFLIFGLIDANALSQSLVNRGLGAITRQYLEPFCCATELNRD